MAKMWSRLKHGFDGATQKTSARRRPDHHVAPAVNDAVRPRRRRPDAVVSAPRGQTPAGMAGAPAGTGRPGRRLTTRRSRCRPSAAALSNCQLP